MAINASTTNHSIPHQSSTVSGTSTKEHVGHAKGPYLRFLVIMAIHFPVMFAVMYTMVNSFSEVFANLNQVYMAGMMVAPMAIIMLLSMKDMYQDKKKNLILHLASAALFVGLFIFMREQTFIGDKQFLRSMIPHHSGAILMCEKSQISDPEIKKLCAQIIESQKDEIAQMKDILNRIE